MAAMDMRRARAIAEQMIRSGQNKGKSLEDLVRQMVGSQEGAGAPGTAIGAALAPVTLTPAATAQPGVPFVAPKSTAQMLPQPQEQELPVAPQRASKYAPMLTGLERQIVAMEAKMADAAKNKQPISPVDKATLAGLLQAANQVSEMKAADESASIPQELQETFANREARIARREELLAEDKARSPFQALLAAGAAGTQGRRGETDVEAITRILQAGFGSYGDARRENLEGIEKLGEARDEARLKQFELGEKVRADAVDLIKSRNTIQKDALSLADAIRQGAVAEELVDPTIQSGKAAASKATTQAKFEPQLIMSQIQDNLASVAFKLGQGRQTSSGGGTGVKGLSTLLTSLDRDAKNLQDLQNDPLTSSADKQQAKQQLAEVNANRNRIRSMIAGGEFGGGDGGGGGAPPVPGATRALDGNYYVKDPKRPGKYLLVS